MHVDLTKKIQSSFFSIEKDTELIVKKLFIEDKANAEKLKRLLVINTPDCLDMTNTKYSDIVNKMSIKDLFKEGYITQKPKIKMAEHEEVKSYLIISYGNWFPSAENPIQFRDCNLSVGVVCNYDFWDMPNYAIRPYVIAGYVDGILAEARLTGLGKLHFATADNMVLNNEQAGVLLMYDAVHGSDDKIPPKDI